MILCVTLNPCLDKTLTVPAWRPGDNVRGRAVREVVGGKGNNVARALTRLGRTARPVTFLGGPVGTVCERLLREDDGLDPLITPSDAPTRVILTARTEGTNDQSAFFDPDPAISGHEAEGLYNRVDGALRAGDVQAVALSGSSPSPHTHALFSELIALARSRQVPTFLDTYGPALREIWGFWPEAIQLNRREAAAHLGKPSPGPDDLLGLLETWGRKGVASAVVTDGPGAAFARVGEWSFRITPPKIDPVNPIGSGDSLLAGLIDGWLFGLDREAMLRRAFGAALSNALVWDAGAVDRTEVQRLGEAVRVERIG